MLPSYRLGALLAPPTRGKRGKQFLLSPSVKVFCALRSGEGGEPLAQGLVRFWESAGFARPVNRLAMDYEGYSDHSRCRAAMPPWASTLPVSPITRQQHEKRCSGHGFLSRRD